MRRLRGRNAPGQRLGALQRIEQDQGERLRQARGQLGADAADQVCAEEGEHHAGRALGFLQSVVLAALLHLTEERFASQSHAGHHPFFFGLPTGVRSAR